MRAFRLALGGIVVASLAAFAVAAGPQLIQRAQHRAALSPALRAGIARALAARPLGFEANRGQTDARVDYIAHGQGYNAFLTPRGPVVALWSAAALRPRSPLALGPPPALVRGPQESAFRVRFLGARAHSHALPLNREQALATYFKPSGRIVAPTFGQVLYSGVYRGIDLRYHGNQQRLEEDWIVRPGASPSAIRLALDGVRRIAPGANGSLVLHVGTLRALESRPIAYQTLDGVRHLVPARWILSGKTLSFAVGAYDRSRPLVIDPTISGSVEVGGGNIDFAIDVDVDDAGNVYVAGGTLSSDFPVAGIGFKQTGGNFDGFVVILTNGLAVEVTLEFGGAQQDDAETVNAESPTDFYVGGVTNSNNFPTKNAAQPTSGGGNCGGIPCFDVFGMQFAGANNLTSSTYLGGSGNDFITGFVETGDGKACLTGYTSSPNFGTLMGPGGGAYDAFVAAFNPNLVLDHVMRFGGAGNDVAEGVDKAGNNIWITGGTFSNSVLGAGTQTKNENPYLIRSTDGGKTWGEKVFIGANDASLGDIFFDPTGYNYASFDGFFPGGNFSGCDPSKCFPTGVAKFNNSWIPEGIVSLFPSGGVGVFSISDLDPFTAGSLIFGLAASGYTYPTFGSSQHSGVGWLFQAGCPDYAVRSAASTAGVAVRYTGEAACPSFLSQVSLPAGVDANGVAADAKNGAMYIAGEALAGVPGVKGQGDAYVAKVTDLGVSPPCECSGITTKVSGAADFHSAGRGTAFSFTVDWFMECTKGAGGCEGAIDVVKPAGTDIKVSQPKAEIKCEGSCSTAGALGTKGRFKVRGTSADSLDPDKRAGKSFTFHFKKFCIINGAKHAEGAGVFTVVYNSHGLVDRRKSDLNGNGKPDGTEKKGK